MDDAILNIDKVSKSFRKGKKNIEAVRNVSLNIMSGESVGLIGVSGCGKSTLSKLITRMMLAEGGRIMLCGEDMTKLKGKKLRQAYRHVKMIFQDSRSSFDPRFTMGESILLSIPKSQKKSKLNNLEDIKLLLEEVGLNESYLEKYPHELSGGECQRVAIARAIVSKPELLICDEATSALDVSVQAQILEVLRRLGQKNNMAFLFISHDLALVSSFCNRIYVMKDGEIIESGETRQIIDCPKSEYTQQLIDAVNNG